MTGSRPIAMATFGSLVATGLIGVVWFLSAHGAARFEPAVASLGVLAGLTGVLAERLTTAHERRHLAAASLTSELEKNRSSLDNLECSFRHECTPRPRVYPRLAVSAADAALISGAFAETRDTQLLQSLHEWRDAANGFNRRLDLTEMRIFAADRLEEVREFERVLRRNHGYLDDLRASLEAVITHVRAASAPYSTSIATVTPDAVVDVTRQKPLRRNSLNRLPGPFLAPCPRSGGARSTGRPPGLCKRNGGPRTSREQSQIIAGVTPGHHGQGTADDGKGPQMTLAHGDGSSDRPIRSFLHRRAHSSGLSSGEYRRQKEQAQPTLG